MLTALGASPFTTWLFGVRPFCVRLETRGRAHLEEKVAHDSVLCRLYIFNVSILNTAEHVFYNYKLFDFSCCLIHCVPVNCA